MKKRLIAMLLCLATLLSLCTGLASAAGSAVKEIPAYCISPTTKGVPQTVGAGESIKYIAMAADRWVTTVYGKTTTTLPKTGY